MKSKAPLAMMEQIVMLLVFALAAALCLQAFVKSDQMSKRSEARDRAAVLCQNAAETIRHSGGDFERASILLGATFWDMDTISIAYGDDCEPRDRNSTDHISYLLELRRVETDTPGLGKARVSVTETGAGDTLFELDIAWQEEVGAHG